MFLDELLLPWNVNATIVLDPDTLIMGDVSSLWNSSKVTTRPWKRSRHAANDLKGEVWVEEGKMTEIDENERKQSAPHEVVAVTTNCDILQSKVRAALHRWVRAPSKGHCPWRWSGPSNN